jgi:hypothetical protein
MSPGGIEPVTQIQVSQSVDPILSEIDATLASYHVSPHLILSSLTHSSKYSQHLLENSSNSTASLPFGITVFSGHDVNILGLLHGLNATLLDSSREDQGVHFYGRIQEGECVRVR